MDVPAPDRLLPTSTDNLRHSDSVTFLKASTTPSRRFQAGDQVGYEAVHHILLSLLVRDSVLPHFIHK